MVTKKTSTKKASEKKTSARITKVKEPAHIGLVKNDSYLAPYEDAIRGRHEHALWKMNQLTQMVSCRFLNSQMATIITDYTVPRMVGCSVNGHQMRPKSSSLAILMIGRSRRPTSVNGWKERETGNLYSLKTPYNTVSTIRCEFIGKEVRVSVSLLGHNELSKTMRRKSSQHRYGRLRSHLFGRRRLSKPQTSPLLIYECHIGMAQDEEKVGTYNEFREKVLPRIIKDGYNAIQIMAIQEHPYYGSFGYHVSSFFAASSRFGTPEDLKALIDEAHKNGVAVIMDIVHSHAVKNEVEGLGNLAGDPNQYFYPGERHEHPAWDSLCFDYGKDEVLHFLLSNCKYWLEEYHFDGFRFDGVTSMLYYSHGLGEAFCNYADYFNGHQDDNAICYLTLANCLIHEVNKNAVTIAEEVSGMPGLAAKFKDGGYGFDYRMAMNIPDYWIKTIKELPDESWKPSSIFWEIKNRRSDEKTISYCESHDQALVGDKTIIFRLVDADMYWHFRKGDETEMVHRGIALHKMIRLATFSCDQWWLSELYGK